jgi:predicted  nucleic acid-binding Zn-ribbon protein
LQEKIEELQSISSLYAGEKQQKADAAQLLKQEVNAIYARFNQVKEDFAGKQQSWQEQLADLATDKEAMISVLSAAEVSWFDSIKDKFNGSPVALLSEAQVCGGCYTIVPAITFKRTRLGQQTYCEKCGRTLFVEE